MEKNEGTSLYCLLFLFSIFLCVCVCVFWRNCKELNEWEIGSSIDWFSFKYKYPVAYKKLINCYQIFLLKAYWCFRTLIRRQSKYLLHKYQQCKKQHGIFSYIISLYDVVDGDVRGYVFFVDVLVNATLSQ